MPCVDSVGYELHAFLGHCPQAPFAALVDKRHIIQVHNASFVGLNSVPLFPARSQFVNPRSDQLALQNPSSFRFRLSNSDLQHVCRSRLRRQFGVGNFLMWTSVPPRSKETSSITNFIRWMPRPCSASRFSLARGSGTASGSKPCPWSKTLMVTPF